jgi:hypothetical protein
LNSCLRTSSEGTNFGFPPCTKQCSPEDDTDLQQPKRWRRMSELASQAFVIVLQHLMVPDLGWYVDPLDIRRNDIRTGFARRMASSEFSSSSSSSRGYQSRPISNLDEISTILEKPLKEDKIVRYILYEFNEMDLPSILSSLETVVSRYIYSDSGLLRLYCV